jgi:glycosyltransferase involved in cell wall biosynthesis
MLGALMKPTAALVNAFAPAPIKLSNMEPMLITQPPPTAPTVRRPSRAVRGVWSGSPVRVCYLIDRLNRAGTETQLLALIRNVNRERVQPFLCFLNGTDDLSRSLELGDCPILRLGVRRLRSPGTVSKAFELARFLRFHRIEVLQTYFQDCAYLGVPVARLAGVTAVVRTRTNLGYELNWIDRLLGRLYCPFIQGTIANSDACGQAALAERACRPGTVTVLENGVDLHRFVHLSRPFTRAGRRVGLVANLRPVKDPELLVRSAADLAKGYPDLSFQIAGEGELRPTLEGLIREFGLADRFHLVGAVTDVPRFLDQTDIAILCSRSEGMSNALLEYMAAGRPIVATAVGGNPGLIEHGRHGLLISAGDQTALTCALRRLLDNPGWACQLGEAARRRAQACYSREAMIERFESFYFQLARA